MRSKHGCWGMGLALVLAGCGAASMKAPSTAHERTPTGEESEVREPAARAVDYAGLLAADDRDDKDRALDAQRKPAALLAFVDAAPGMRIGELGAGTGYTTELLARAVGPEGTVYGHNSAFLLERFAQEPWSARLEKPVMRQVVRKDRPFDDPFGEEVRDLDAVVVVLFYHDTVWQEVDRARMNAAVFAALKPGGRYIIVDHSAREGAGVSDVKTLHRIEESVVRSEVEAAGFTLVDEADFLRNPEDARDWNAAPSAAAERRGTSDRFVLAFRKNAAD